MKNPNFISPLKRKGGYRSGDIIYLQDHVSPFGFRRPLSGVPESSFFVRKNPWQVQFFQKDDTVFVKSLRDGRTATVPMWKVKVHDKAGLFKIC